MTNDITQPIVSWEGAEVGVLTFPGAIFGKEPNPRLLSEAARVMAKNKRTPIAHAKDRGDVRGGGIKPWRQKGTGRARHGSIRSPICIGGGVAHGPTKHRIYSTKINQQVKDTALAMAIGGKLRDGQLVVVTDMNATEAEGGLRTNIMNKRLRALRPSGSILVVTAEPKENISRALRNIPKVRLTSAARVSVLDILSHMHVIIEQTAVSILEKRLT